MQVNLARPGATPGRLSCLTGLAFSLLLAGCAVGPDFKSPELPSQAGFQSSKPGNIQTNSVTAKEAGTAGGTQTLSSERNLPADWWTLFHSPELNAMIQEALQHSPTLEAAEAAVRQAQESVNAQTGSLEFPTINATGSAARQHQVQGTPPAKSFTVYSGGLSVSYALDVFGGGRRELEGLVAQADYQRYQLEAARQTLIYNVVTTAVQAAALSTQIDATRLSLSAQTTQLDIVLKQNQLGAQPLSAVLTQQQLVEQTRSTLLPLEKSLSQARDQLAVYLGHYPSEQSMPQLSLEHLQLPKDLPLSLPSELVRQRPDIQASEAMLHQASARVGVATANLYPQINLTGSFNRQRTDMNGNSSFASLWNMGAGLTMPLLDGGVLRAQRRGAMAAYDQAKAQYRQTVLKAFQNVSDTLHAIEADAGTLDAQANLATASRRLRDITRQRYQLGAVSYLTVLDAERSYQLARSSLASAQAARFADTAMLYMALGGGWWNRNEHAEPGGHLQTAASHDNNIQ